MDEDLGLDKWEVAVDAESVVTDPLPIPIPIPIPMPVTTREASLAPVTLAPTRPEEVAEERPKPEHGIALCLSGGGYRAMLFHLGALWRLNELGYLPKIRRVCSVSGGSITAGALGVAWNALDFTGREPDVAANFNEKVVLPVRQLARRTIDWVATASGLLSFVGFASSSAVVSRAYRRHLYGRHTLQALPARRDGPEFCIVAANLQSGVLWHFTRDFAGDYLVGWMPKPEIGIAEAVAASSAFPPFLAPAVFNIEGKMRRSRLSRLHDGEFIKRAVLADGGVYDNLGLEPAWKYFDTILASDGGMKLVPIERPRFNWLSQLLRVRDIADHQVRGLRSRWLVGSYRARPGDENHREGAYWGIRTTISEYGVETLECPPSRVALLANVQTGLSRIEDPTQERLINWGYAVCDAAMRAHVDPAASKPSDFPYPDREPPV